MSDAADRRLFTVSEANALLPALIPVPEALKADHATLEQTRHDFGIYAASLRAKGLLVEGHRIEAEIAELVTRLRGGINTLVAQGIEIKNLEWGLIDFPALRNGHLVYLCWRLGEGPISYWHDLDAGFPGRQPLDANDDAFS